MESSLVTGASQDQGAGERALDCREGGREGGSQGRTGR